MNILKHAERELDILVKSATDPNNRPIIEPFIPEILALVKKFGESGQSGGSASYTASAISQAIKSLCLYEPICDITGHDDEWFECAPGEFQNRRCSALFKMGKEGNPYYLDAIAWKTLKGSTWSGTALSSSQERIMSRHYVKSFPFKPKTFVIDVVEEEIKEGDWEFYVRYQDQLDEAFEYYNKYPYNLKPKKNSSPIDNTPTSPSL